MKGNLEIEAFFIQKYFSVNYKLKNQSLTLRPHIDKASF